MMRVGTSLALIATMLLGLTLGAPAVAQETEAGSEVGGPIDFEALATERKRMARLHPLGKRISRYLAAAQKKAEDDSPEAGLALLDKLRMPALNPIERAYVYQMRGYISYGAADYDTTIVDFEKMLAEEAMPLDAENRIRFGIAQIYVVLQQWEKAIAALDRWFRYNPDPNPLGYYMLGISYYQIGEIDLAIENTEKAIDMSEEPQEGWLQLLAALYVQKEDYASATPVLEELVITFPKKQYWNQLSLIYGARDDYRHSLAAQQVAHAQGFLTEDKELRRLVRSYLYAELPYPAAKLLEKGIADGSIEADAGAYEMLANSFIAAREYDRSLPPLLKAAELSEDGKLLVRLAQVYLQREDWNQAAEKLEQALDKGGLENPGSAELLLGIAYYESQRVPRARTAFKRARGYQKAREEAERWLTHIDNETNEANEG